MGFRVEWVLGDDLPFGFDDCTQALSNDMPECEYGFSGRGCNSLRMTVSLPFERSRERRAWHDRVRLKVVPD